MICIVGGGLAGSVLARKFFQKTKDIVWIKDDQSAASHISSGIVNPITGRNYVETWRYEEFLSKALEFYGEYLTPIRIRKRFTPYNDTTQAIDLVSRNSKYLEWIDGNWIEIKDSYQLQTTEFLRENEIFLKDKIEVIYEKFDYNSLHSMDDKWQYKTKKYDKIIFAEGIQAFHNPFLTSIEIIPNRGEVLTMDIDDFELEYVVKDGKFICNFDGKYWIGSSFERVQIDAPKKTEKLYNELREHIPILTKNKPVKNLIHHGEFRATTYDRRPVMGEVSDFPNIYIFNGFGTKGSSLIPTCADELIGNIVDHKPIIDEVSVRRFIKKKIISN